MLCNLKYQVANCRLYIIDYFRQPRIIDKTSLLREDDLSQAYL